MKHILTVCFVLAISTTAFTKSPSHLSNPATITLKATVRCDEGKHPIPSDIIIITEANKSIQPVATGKGEFSIQLPFTSSFKILAKANGYEPTEKAFDIPNVSQDTTLAIQIYLTPVYELVLEGNILDAKTNLPIAAEFDLFFDSDIVKQDVQIVSDGKYREVVSKPGWYIIDILSPGYISVSDTAWIMHSGTRRVVKDYRLTPIEVGLNVVIENLYFYFGHTELKPESAASLNKIVAFIEANPTITLEIAGHTDDEGADDYNLTLSQGRAEAVVKYLIGVGIDSSRLTARGYGETKPIENAKTKAAKARNRRVEFTILKM